MRLARIRTDDGPATGEYDGDAVTVDGERHEIGEDAELLAPCEPSAVYCVGRNYVATIEQMGYERPDQPTVFIKPPVSVIPSEAAIPYPTFSEEVTYAGELAAVIDEEAKDISKADAPDVVRGYTIMNDVDALDQPGLTERKAFDGSGPLGPCLSTDVDPTDLEIRTTINGEVRQEGHTSDMLFGPFEIIAFVTERLTLHPGDVVTFGSPANPGLIEPGDEIEIYYDDVGTLRNTVDPPG